MNSEFLKKISYFVDDDNVGVKSFLILIVVMFDKILLSTSSIIPVNFESFSLLRYYYFRKLGAQRVVRFPIVSLKLGMGWGNRTLRVP